VRFGSDRARKALSTIANAQFPGPIRRRHFLALKPAKNIQQRLPRRVCAGFVLTVFEQ
jgi:hypothetical protein